MFASNQDKAAKSAGQILKDLRGAVLEQLAGIGDRLRLRRLFRWLQDETGHSKAMHELALLNDYCLDDIGIKRPLDPRTDDLVRRLRAGG
jgi:hypothetical protein